MDSDHDDEMESFLGNTKPPAAFAEHYSDENLPGQHDQGSRTVDIEDTVSRKGTPFERKAALINEYV